MRIHADISLVEVDFLTGRDLVPGVDGNGLAAAEAELAAGHGRLARGTGADLECEDEER
jgi:hypothetical protein